MKSNEIGTPTALSRSTVTTCVLASAILVGLAAGAEAQSTELEEVAKLLASDAAAFDTFGYSVSLSGDTAVVGAYRDDNAGGCDAGSAYVFVRNGTTWTEQAKLVASDAAAFDNFGYSVSLSGDTAVVGAWQDDNVVGPKQARPTCSCAAGRHGRSRPS